MTFSRIGYLHFGRNHEQPIESLRIELEENRNNVCNALVVLPEGFNIRKFCWDKAKSDAGSEVLDDLKRLSREYGAAFVVGLTIRFPNQPLYSSAYLIDEERPPEVICHKEHDDGSLNYRPCPHEECDTRNPIECRCCWIGAMICMDAGWGPNTRRYDGLVKEMNKPCTCSILCIPACARDPSFFSDRGLGIYPELENINAVVANSDRADGKSFIVVNGKAELHYSGPENKIVLSPLR